MQRGYKAVLTLVFIILPVLAFFSLVWADVQAKNDDQPYADGRLGSGVASFWDGLPLYPGDEKWEGIIKYPVDEVTGKNFKYPAEELAGSINDMAAIGNDLYVGGSFNGVGAKQILNLARWNGQVWSAVGGPVNGRVWQMAKGNNSLYIAGGFTQIGSVNVNCLAYWDGSTWHPIDNEFIPGVITAMETRGTDLIVAGATSDQEIHVIITAWNGSTWTKFGEVLNGYVYSMLVVGKDVYIAGDFKSVDGLPVNGIAHWDGSKWNALGDGVEGKVNALAAVGNKIYAGGYTGDFYYNRNALLTYWDGSQWHKIDSMNNFGYVSSLATIGSDLYIAGFFGYDFQTSDRVANGIARWDGSRMWNVGSGLIYGPVKQIVAEGDRVYAGDSFESAGNKTALGLAVWHTKPELSLNYNSGAPGSSFLIQGRYFTPGNYFLAAVNEEILNPTQLAPEQGPVLRGASMRPVDPWGNLAISIATAPLSKPGKYQVTVYDFLPNSVFGPTEQTIIYSLDPAKPVRPAVTNPETPVTVVVVPPTINPGAFYHFYLPGAIKPGR